ncbi:MAG: hypothetical protein U0175_22660 [Caldilineaceae bacterium]
MAESTQNLPPLEQIRRIQQQPPTNWPLPDEYAIRIAQPLAKLPPDQAIKKAKEELAKLQKINDDLVLKLRDAEKFVADLKDSPITNLGGHGLRGLFLRWLMSMVNGTPFSLNWIEVTDKGLQLYNPFSAVSNRTITFSQILSGEIALAVDPPAYFDWILGVIRQFRKNVTSPWGEITVYERGSGKVIANAIAIKPAQKIDQMKAALAQIHRVRNPYEGHKQLPRLVDLLMYYDAEAWQERLESGTESEGTT